jgi:TPR repeat protein
VCRSGALQSGSQSVSQDDEAAVKWFLLNAEKGDARAQFKLGVMYEYDRGVAQRLEDAAKWYGMAAEQGYPSAQFFRFFVQIEADESAGLERFKWLFLAASTERKYALQWR